MTHKFITNFVLRRASGDEGYGAGSGPCDVHSGGPGTPSLAVSGRHEGYRQSQVP